MKIIKITKDKITLEVCYNNNRINKEFEEERADPKYRPPPLGELFAVHISQLIINSVRKMKSINCTHLNLHIERGILRAKSIIKTYFLDREFDMKLA